MAQLVEQEKHASPRLAHYLAEYRRSLEQGPPQPRWVAQARESAIAQFERLGFPTTKIEQWRFTSVEPIAERTFALATDGVEQAAPQARAAQRSDCPRRVRQRPVCAAVIVESRQTAEGRADSRARGGARLTAVAARTVPRQAVSDADERLHIAQYRVPPRRHRGRDSRAQRHRAADRNYLCLGIRERRVDVASTAADRGRRGITGDRARTLCRSGRRVHERRRRGLARRQRRGRSLQAAGRGRGRVPHRQHVSALPLAAARSRRTR